MHCSTAGPTKVAVWQYICGNKHEGQSFAEVPKKTSHNSEASAVGYAPRQAASTGSRFERKRTEKKEKFKCKNKQKKMQINKEAVTRRRHGIKYTLSPERERQEGKEYEVGRKGNEEIGRGRGRKGQRRKSKESLSIETTNAILN